MQVTKYNNRTYQEFFSGDSDEEVVNNMNQKLLVNGHTLVRRMKIGRNDNCPCGSGKKFKKCCIDKINDSELYEVK